MHVVLIAGGVGGARFTRGLRRLLRSTGDSGHRITVIVNTGDDLWVDGLRVCPDLDTVMYTLAGVVHPEQGWGRAGETSRVHAELQAYGAGLPWFTLGDLDLATHVARTSLLRSGVPLSAVTARLCARWDLGATLLPMSDQEVETWVEVEDEAGGTHSLHFEEWWVRHRAGPRPLRFTQRGVGSAGPAPGVLEALRDADVVLLPPSNPVVSIGTVLGVPGVRDALRATRAPVVGLSPLIGDAPLRGMADVCLRAVGARPTATGVAAHLGRRGDGGVLDGWLVDTADADQVEDSPVPTRAVPLLMHDDEATAAMAAQALELADHLRA